ncbi:phenylacetate-CoA oxygenase subunit PaaC [Actinoplanes sp. KI2]|uniref:1,2-phenylacetyl-CoA epoxidase subunit PaaC n=1 Tax=Actinoplanes sp. KI2 TaxID=2983315 RepID=UPI0021D60DBA|nr:1,2-phenylacetyl-CoA epoxidase subunit PaaC [Actinoplanes sp. KI2]MCU7727391.1 phenylacetate-CoA oxygenase subunit PaaC [Actinoplanes sp. KI2]
MSFDDDAYGALTDHTDDARWAYGTGFADPLAGVSTAVPGDVDRADLAAYCLMLGDDALVLSHRLQQWVTRAPELEDELALANIGLDLLGQARLLLGRAGEVEGAGRDEDALAYLRDAAEFRNVRLAELADADFAHLVARLLVFSCWRLPLLDRLAGSRDPVLAAIGAKGLKEVTYHREYAAQWVVRLGDGTDLSHQRMQTAIDAVRPEVGELFETHDVEARLASAGIAVDPALLRPEFDEAMSQVLDAATVTASTPAAGGSTGGGRAGGGSAGGGSAGGGRAGGGSAGGGRAGDGSAGDGSTGGGSAGDGSTGGGSTDGGRGRDGVHGPELGEVLAEMQELARALPGGVW